MPAYTQGMATRHQFIDDTTANKIAATYKEGDLSITAAQMKWNIGDKNSLNPGVEWDATETIADIIYSATKELKLRYRINVNDSYDVGSTSGQRDWTEHRVIVSYKF